MLATTTLLMSRLVALTLGWPPDDDGHERHLDDHLMPNYHHEIDPPTRAQPAGERDVGPFVGADMAAGDHACHGFERSGAAWLTLHRQTCRGERCTVRAELVRVAPVSKTRTSVTTMLALGRYVGPSRYGVDFSAQLTRRKLLQVNSLLLAARVGCDVSTPTGATAIPGARAVFSGSDGARALIWLVDDDGRDRFVPWRPGDAN